jgi:hypothetical protein
VFGNPPPHKFLPTTFKKRGGDYQRIYCTWHRQTISENRMNLTGLVGLTVTYSSVFSLTQLFSQFRVISIVVAAWEFISNLSGYHLQYLVPFKLHSQRLIIYQLFEYPAYSLEFCLSLSSAL